MVWYILPLRGAHMQIFGKAVMHDFLGKVINMNMNLCFLFVMNWSHISNVVMILILKLCFAYSIRHYQVNIIEVKKLKLKTLTKLNAQNFKAFNIA